jgi:hypothetical protein
MLPCKSKLDECREKNGLEKLSVSCFVVEIYVVSKVLLTLAEQKKMQMTQTCTMKATA